MTSVITNSNLNDKAAAVASPYGVLTRVGDAPAISPNSHIPVEFTSALGVTVFLSYDDFSNGRAERILEDAHAGRGMNVKTWVELRSMFEFIYRWMVATDASAPYADANLQKAFAFAAMNPALLAQAPNYSDMPEDRIELAFTLSDAGSNAAAVANTTTGDYDRIMWDWGDGSYTFTTSGNPANHTYGSSGSKTVTAIAMGRGGIVRLAKSVTLA